MPVIVIAGALIAQGPEAVCAQHLLDALAFDERNIVSLGEAPGASLYFGQELARCQTPEQAVELLASPEAQALLLRVSEQWEGDAEALMLRSQMGLDQPPVLLALPEPARAAPKAPRVSPF